MSNDIVPGEAKSPKRPAYGWFRDLLRDHAGEWISLEWLAETYGATYSSLASYASRADHRIQTSDDGNYVSFIPKTTKDGRENDDQKDECDR